MNSTIENGINLIERAGKSAKRRTLRLLSRPRYLRRKKQIINRMRNKLRTGRKINVLFVIQYPEMWNSEKSVYKAVREDKRFNAILLTVPKLECVSYTELKLEKTNAASDFFKAQGLPFHEAVVNGALADISLLKPDLIFIQRPYSHYMPENLKFDRLSDHAIICYIPYGYEFVNNVHLDIEYNTVFINNVYCCFAENSETRDFIRKSSLVDYRIGLRNIFDLGYPRFDLIDTIEKNVSKRNSVLWTPRWSVSDENDRSYFFDYYDVLIGFFRDHPQMNMIIRPHPLMFKHFIEKGIMSEKEIDDLKASIEKMPNVSLDPNVDYLETFSQSDILVSDFSSLIIEYYATNKPTLYCGDSAGFNSVGRAMDKGLYHINNAEELVSTLEYLSCHKDKFFKYNKKVIQRLIKRNGNIGEAVKNAILDTYIL